MLRSLVGSEMCIRDSFMGTLWGPVDKSMYPHRFLVWDIYGHFMGTLWALYGVLWTSPCTPPFSCMGHIWALYGVLWTSPCTPPFSCMGHIWALYGHFMGTLWGPVDRSEYPHLFLVWDIYGHFKGTLWALYGHFMGSYGQVHVPHRFLCLLYTSPSPRDS